MYKPLTRLLKKKKMKSTQINKIRNEKEKVSANIAKIQGIIRDYYVQLYANTMDNLGDKDKFLER